MPELNRRRVLAAGLAAVGLSAACAGTNSRSAPSRTAWDGLSAHLRGSLALPGSPDYPVLATPRNLRFAATMPAAVALCADAADVAATITWARDTNTPLAVRGGGHNYADGSATRGILISTRRMNAATVDGTSLRAQAGVRNSEIAALLPRADGGHLLLPGGTCPGVGLTGLTLGGGIGPNAPWAGLTADRLRNATMVTAGGEVVTASATENPDLFWALRGGAGGNFGVVTELEYELVEIPVGRATTAELTVTGSEAAVAAALGFQELRAEADRTATGEVHLGRSGTAVTATLAIQILAGQSDARDLLSGLLAIPGMRADIAERDWWDAYGWYVTEPRPPYSFWDRSLYADDTISGDVLSTAVDVLRRFPVGADPLRKGAMGLLGWVGGAVADIAPGDTAYVHRRARAIVEMTSQWTTPPRPEWPATAIPADILDWEDELWQTLLPHTTGRSYQNFPDPELPDWPSAYYGDNLVRIEGVKAKWDPDAVFTHQQGVPLPR
ncbi:MAG: FAD-dependent oxidoreductase [Mycobacterium sp.]|nr:FAD-dependent oxidoreductase [Mycobacterium sp.]